MIHQAENCWITPVQEIAELKTLVEQLREVIDIPAKIPVRITEHQTIRRKCISCDAWHAPRVDISDEVSGQHRFGHNLVAWVCYLKQRMRLPFAKIKELVCEQMGLQISTGEWWA